jgi:hypothetical protein
VSKPDPTLRRLERLSQRLSATEEKAAGMRDELYREMLAARAEGVTLSAMARALGISRQRVQKIFERLDR